MPALQAISASISAVERFILLFLSIISSFRYCLYDLQTNIYTRNTNHLQEDLTITARPIKLRQENFCKPPTRSAVDGCKLSDIRGSEGSRLNVNINFYPGKTKMISSFLTTNWCSFHTYPHSCNVIHPQ